MNSRIKTRIVTEIVMIGVAIASMLGGATPSQAQTNKPASTVTTNAPKWASSAALGFTITGGNTKTVLGTLTINSARKTTNDETLLGAAGAYGENSGVKNAESADMFGQYNHTVTDGFYWGLRLDGYHDAIAAVTYRLTAAPLLGYYFIKTTNTTLALELGPAAVYEKLGGPNGTTHGFETLRLGQRYEHKFSPAVRLWEKAEILPQVDNFRNYVVNSEVGLEAALSKKASLRTYVDDTYYNEPVAGRLKNDAKLVTAIAYKF